MIEDTPQAIAAKADDGEAVNAGRLVEPAQKG